MSARKIPSNLPRSASRARSCQYRIVLYSVERSRGWVHIPCWIWPTQFMSNALRRISFVIGQVPGPCGRGLSKIAGSTCTGDIVARRRDWPRRCRFQPPVSDNHRVPIEDYRMPQIRQAGTRTRDLLGYAGSPPDPRWPGGARVAVSIVVNFEEGAEFSISDGDPENEAVYEIEQRLAGRPDPAIDSHFEYGSRAGWWRIMEVLGQHGAPATVSSSGRAVERLPLLAQDAVRRGHEISAHGWRWEGHADLDESEERDRIARTVAAIKAVTGTRPVGWHTRSPGSVNTRRLLVEEGGFLYDSDAYNDDLPYFVQVGDKRHLVLPYAFDTNDMQFFHTNRFSGAADFAAYAIDAFDWLHREGAHAPKMMSIGLHLRMIGRPGRIGALDRILRHITNQGDAWIARRVDIANHWLAQFPSGGPTCPHR